MSDSQRDAAHGGQAAFGQQIDENTRLKNAMKLLEKDIDCKNAKINNWNVRKNVIPYKNLK